METMEKLSVTHGTFVIERTYSVPPERVFGAFRDPAKKRRWMREGNEAMEFEIDFRVGGKERSRFLLGENTPFPGTQMTNDTVYMDIVPNRRIVIAYPMAMGERRFSSSQATFELVPSEKGTDLIFTEQGAYFEGSDGAQMRQAGWTHLLERLSKELS